MCEPITLYQGREGYVIHCKYCRCTQIAFGTSLIDVELKDFDFFLEMIRDICSDVDEYTKKNRKSVFIPTPCRGVAILLTPSEVFRFRSILEKVDVEIKANELIQLFGS